MNKKKGIFAMTLSFILNNLLAVVACLLIMTLFGFILDTSFGWLLYVLMLIICAFLIYHQAWQYGSRDLDNNFGKRIKVAALGGVVAACPSLIMGVFCVLIDVGVYSPSLTVFGQSAVAALYRFWNMPFRIMFDYFMACPWLYFVPCIAVPVFATVGYILGYKRLRLSDYLYYEREKGE